MDDDERRREAARDAERARERMEAERRSRDERMAWQRELIRDGNVEAAAALDGFDVGSSSGTPGDSPSGDSPSIDSPSGDSPPGDSPPNDAPLPTPDEGYSAALHDARERLASIASTADAGWVDATTAAWLRQWTAAFDPESPDAERQAKSARELCAARGWPLLASAFLLLELACGRVGAYRFMRGG